MKRKKHKSQDVKDYLSYIQKARHKKIPKTDTVFKWYFDVLMKNNIDPLTLTHDHPEYGENGSVTFPDDFE